MRTGCTVTKYDRLRKSIKILSEQGARVFQAKVCPENSVHLDLEETAITITQREICQKAKPTQLLLKLPNFTNFLPILKLAKTKV